MATIIGNAEPNLLIGGPEPDRIYGFDPNSPERDASIVATRLAAGLTSPVFVTAPSGNLNQLFVVEKAGLIKILNLATSVIAPVPFLDLRDQIDDAGEQGLLGLAFHPDYASNGLFYVNLINNAGDTEIRSYRRSTDPNIADPASGQLVIRIDQPEGLANHKAGWLGFGPDGFLYAALGDGGGGGDPLNSGQNLQSLLGKILRIDVARDDFPSDPSRNYDIPSGNPFAAGPGADEIWAYGLRNPWRPSFDRVSGTLFIADVGQGQFEEIDVGAPGANYGWRLFEGPVPFIGDVSGTVLTPPIFFYGRDVGQSVTGGYVYRGESEGLQGHYFFADFVSARIFTFAPDGGRRLGGGGAHLRGRH